MRYLRLTGRQRRLTWLVLAVLLAVNLGLSLLSPDLDFNSFKLGSFAPVFYLNGVLGSVAVLELLRWLNGQADPALDQSERWYVAMRLFYPEFAALPQPLWPDATQFLTEFLAAGRREQPRPGPALMDWQQDAPLIAAGISKAAGQDVRTLPYLHWWSFLAWFDAIGEGSFATVVAIRDKLRRGKRLENWELDYYRTHRAVVELRGVESAEEQAEKRRLLELLGG